VPQLLFFQRVAGEARDCIAAQARPPMTYRSSAFHSAWIAALPPDFHKTIFPPIKVG